MSNNAAAITLGVWQGGTIAVDTAYRWEDTTQLVYEPFVGWSDGGAEPKLHGLLYDAMIVNGAGVTGETTFTFDGHTWIYLTDGPNAAHASTCALALVIA